MCGICGFTSRNFDPDALLIRRMCATLHHRGPDDEGYYTHPQLQMGMRRLSIIDVDMGHQPITNEDQSLWLVFNGEIYNYRELCESLIQQGHYFATASDSEVILHAYETYGDRCVEYFNGMFAFAIWDCKRNRLLLGRDHLGIKPLFYWTDGEELVFGSELKALLKHPAVPRTINPVALDQFLSLEYIPTPHTIFQGVRKLPAGHILVFENGTATVSPYWDFTPRPVPSDRDVCAEELAALIKDAVRLQMVSDVPLGAFLSGGVDSSTIVAMMSQLSSQPVRTFSIGFHDVTYNELPYARAVATQFNTQHSEAILEPDIANLALQLVQHLDEPFADFSIFPTYLVSQLAQGSVKVILSGDGGDEVFGGYDTYVAQHYDGLYQHLPVALRQRYLPRLFAKIPPGQAKKGLLNKAKRFVEGASLDVALQHTRWMIFMDGTEKSDLYTADFKAEVNQDLSGLFECYFERAAGYDSLAQQQYVDIKTYLVDDILTKVDRMSMAASIEARVPLLDYRIVEFALSLPQNMKLQRGQTKVILKQAMKHLLPDQILHRPKQGFSIPLKHWLRGPLRPLMLDLLSDASIRSSGYFAPRTVQHWMQEHLNGQANHSHQLWALMVFQLWRSQIQGTTIYD